MIDIYIDDTYFQYKYIIFNMFEFFIILKRYWLYFDLFTRLFFHDK